MSYTLTVHIEARGTRHTGSNGKTTPSAAGRVWMSLKNNDTNETVNYGYTPVKSPTVYGDGKVIHNDDVAYQGNSDKSMNDVVRTALDKNDINFVTKREYVKNIKIASNLDNFRSFKENHL